MDINGREYINAVNISDEEFEKYTKFSIDCHNQEYHLKRAELFGYGDTVKFSNTCFYFKER